MREKEKEKEKSHGIHGGGNEEREMCKGEKCKGEKCALKGETSKRQKGLVYMVNVLFLFLLLHRELL